MLGLGNMSTASSGIPSHVVWQLAGIPASTLDYWVRIGLVRPSLRGSDGQRAERWWTVEDVVVVRAVRALRQAGAPLQRVRRVRKLLEDWGRPLSGVRLFWDGRDILIAGSDGGLTSGLTNPGQYMLQLTILPLGEWHEQAQQLVQPVDVQQLRRRAAERRRARQAQLDAPSRLVERHATALARDT
jgi:DNA-binding transcriptional MerR regulator